MTKHIIIFVSICLILLSSSLVVGQSLDHNYVQVKTMKTQEDNPTLIYNYPENKLNNTITYLDGLGRTDQVVKVKFTSYQNDLIQPYKYDNSGRVSTEYLPYPADVSTGVYRDEWDENAVNEGELLAYYTATPWRVARTPYPWSKRVYDDSPLNRIIQQGAPGKHWQTDRHPIEYNYSKNSAEEYVFKFETSGGNYSTDGYYDPGDLFVLETIDENNQVSREFKDKLGRVVLKEADTDDGKIRTYYVYDDLDNLVLVIPPIPACSLVNNSAVLYLDQFCYQYTYDHKKRLVEKKLPGKDVEYYVYDVLDRIFLQQDGNLREDGIWIYHKYDIMGREIMSGKTTYFTQTSRALVQGQVDNEMTLPYETRLTSTTFGYTNQVIPGVETNGEVLTASYFDTYFIPSTFDANYDEYINPNSEFFTHASSWQNNAGRLTGEAVKVLDGGNNYLFKLYFYDKYGRTIQLVEQNHKGGYDRITTEFDFIGKVKFSLHEHHILGGSPIQEWYRYTYDEGDRLTRVKYKIGEPQGAWLILSEMEYNELGQLVEKNIHSEDQGESFWQSIDYKYNVRGWLTNINRANLGNDNYISVIDEGLEDEMMMGSLKIDTISYKILHNTSREEVDNYISVEIWDSKTAEIVKVEDSTQIGGIETGDVETLYFYENIQEDSLIYAMLSEYDDSTFVLSLDGLVFEDTSSVASVLDSISYYANQQLPGQGVTSQDKRNVIITHMQAFSIHSISADYLNEDGDDLFGMDIYYTTGIDELNSELQYNGNISSIAWKTVNDDNKRGYGFQYDDLYRLTDAAYGEKSGNMTIWNKNMNDYSVQIGGYDYHGNIGTLKRMTPGATGPIYLDNLDYQYSGNQLAIVEENGTVVTDYLYDFKNRNVSPGLSSPDYTYDDNGNMDKDLNKGMEITYNHLNLPETITFEEYNGANKIEYLYDASGRKLSKKIYQSGTLTSNSPVHYIGNLIYNDDDLEMIMNEDGQVDVSLGYQHQYFIKDHLGSNRIMFTEDATSDNMIVLQENHYYPFGMKFAGNFTNCDNWYQYNGKELQGEAFEVPKSSSTEFIHFDWYDYGARFYDPAIGRFHTVDPMAEDAPGWSPYNYTFNNPINLIDPDGQFPIIPPGALAAASVWLAEKGAALERLVTGTSGNINAPAGMVPESTQRISKVVGTVQDATTVAEGVVDVAEGAATVLGSVPGAETVVDVAGTAINLAEGDLEGAAPYAAGLLLPVSGKQIKLGKSTLEGATKGSLSGTKKALKQAKEKLGLGDGSLPKGKQGKFGSPQRGDSKKGYRLDPAHPNAKKGSGEEYPHINVWDYTKGKRGKGGVEEVIPIKR